MRIATATAGHGPAPAGPELVAVLAALRDPAAGLAGLAPLVERVPGLAERVGALARSPYLGLLRPPAATAAALAAVGRDAVWAIAVLHAAWPVVPAPHEFWAHAATTAAAAAAVGQHTGAGAGPSFAAGLVHDVLAHVPDCGGDHATAGAERIYQLGMDPDVVGAVAHHHRPGHGGPLAAALRAGEAIALAVRPLAGHPDAGDPGAALAEAGLPGAWLPAFVARAGREAAELEPLLSW